MDDDMVKKDYAEFDMALRAMLMRLALSDGQVDKEILTTFFTENSRMIFNQNKWVESSNVINERYIDESEMTDELLDLFNRTRIEFVAGGSIINLLNRNIPFNDYDTYFSDPRDAEACTHYCIKDGAICRNISKSSITFEMPYKLQIIKRYYGNPATILSTFDIEACKVGVHRNYGKYKLYYTDKAIEDIKNKKISINDVSSNFIGMFYRLQKYIAKGFEIDPQYVLKFYIQHCDDIGWLRDMYNKLDKPEEKKEILETLEKMKYSSHS